MARLLKKIAVLLPVIVLTFFYLRANYASEYSHAGTRRLALFAITLIILYAWFFREAWVRNQDSVAQFFLQSSFFVYIFMVLTLTGYFVLFREISSQGSWDRMVKRFEHRDHVNMQLFEIFRIYKSTDKQILGNFVMLLPLGIYLPLLYKRLRGFFPVLLVSMLSSILIEFFQLVTRYRSADIDDVLLNTAGACVGYIIYRLVKALVVSKNQSDF
jgi:glycopeptide antibiotics resistance protein